MAGLFDTLRSGAWLRPRPPLTETAAGRDNGESKTAVRPSPAFRAMAGGRVSVDRLYEGYSTVTTVEAPPDADSTWRTMNLDRRTLDSLSPARLLELLA